MKTGIGDEYSTLFHYFLGELPEGEQEAVEERYMLDQAYAGLRDEVEMDLVDAYVGGTLSSLERRHFERRYLVTRERREGVQAAYLSRVYRERIARPKVHSRATPGLVFLREKPLIFASAAALVVTALAGTGWLIYESWNMHREIASVSETAVNRPSRPPGTLQNAGRDQAIPAPPSKGKDFKVEGPQPASVAPAVSLEPPPPLKPPVDATVAHPSPYAYTPPTYAPPPRHPPSVAVVPQQPAYVDTPPSYSHDPASRAAIQEKLEAEYQITKTTYDKSDIVTAGSLLMLHKDKILMVAATSTANPCMNTYKEGRIVPNKACGVDEKLRHLPGFSRVPGGGSAPATRDFVSGDKFWVTKIEVKDDGIVFDFFTDATPSGDQDIRYKGALKIPFGALTPTPDEALEVVSDVITVAPSDSNNSARVRAARTGISPGQTTGQVVAILGQPAVRANLGNKQIYFYRDMKITFVDGKVTDIQ